jgi:tRNA-Thr(GGU) m(6)t(6)A37 methyltransferase TsaA
MHQASSPSTVSFAPIGVFRGAATYKYDAPRQGVFDGGTGVIELAAGRNFETALRDLDGFERIWVLFLFDRNGGEWRPTTRPPVAVPGLDRVGVFASRAPYRPNPIGLSCVRLVAVKGRTLEIAEADLLDGTPILDIKPYIPAADAFPDAHAGWVDAQRADRWQVNATDPFAADAAFVRAHGGPDLLATARLQLGTYPFDDSRKRVVRTGDATGTLSLRMFRIDFETDAATRTVTLTALRSGYTQEELAEPDDPYADKSLHRAFVARA